MALLRNVTGSRTLRAATGEGMEVRTVTGPSSYQSTDGFSVTSNLGRVDEFTVQTPSDSVISKNDNIVAANTMVTKAYSVNTNATGGLSEYSQDADLSGNDFVLTAYRL